MKVPRNYRNLDKGDLGILKYSKEYYEDLWKYGYKSGTIKPKYDNNYAFHRNVANQFDKKFGYSYYDKKQKRMVKNRSKNSKRYYSNLWKYKYK